MKALLDEEFLRCFLDPAFVLFDRAWAEFWHSAYKNERPYFYLHFKFVSRTKPVSQDLHDFSG